MLPQPSFYRIRGKRLFDLALTVPALWLCAPSLLLLALMVRRSIGAPALFRQERLGEGGRPFTIFKLRTMTDARDVGGNLLPDAERLTRLGRVLRASSLDELPELLNVLRGDMSLVGPRPLFSKYAHRYSPRQRRRHEVKPGITGWAQVNGRNALGWEAKFEYDVWYVEHLSLGLDLRILGLTLWKLLRREGISQPGEATAAEFLGQTCLGQME